MVLSLQKQQQHKNNTEQKHTSQNLYSTTEIDNLLKPFDWSVKSLYQITYVQIPGIDSTVFLNFTVWEFFSSI
jgi:hypothetical protein